MLSFGTFAAELKLPHTKVRHILKNVPSEITFFADPKSGNAYIVLKRAIMTKNEASTSGSAHSRQGSTSSGRQDSRQLSASVPASSSRLSAGPSTFTLEASASASTSRQPAKPTPLFADDSESSETEGTNSDVSESGRKRTSRVTDKDDARRHSDSTWAMQRPKEQQMHTKEVANASISPQKRDRFAHPGPRKSAPVASRSVSAQQEKVVPRLGGAEESDEEDLLSAIRESQSAAPPSKVPEGPPEPSLAIPVRKQPAPPSVDALRETAAGHGLDSHGDGTMFNRDDAYNAYSGGDHMTLDNGGDATLTPSRYLNNDFQEQYGEELRLDQMQSQAGPSRHTLDGEEDDEDDFDLDMNTRRRSTSRSHHRTSSGGGSARKEVPDLLFDGYKATRSRGRWARPGPPGMDEASVRIQPCVMRLRMQSSLTVLSYRLGTRQYKKQSQ